MRYQGIVKFWVADKGWGFITRDDRKEFFCHQSAILMRGFRALGPGTLVTFEVDRTDRPKAIKVKLAQTEREYIEMERI